MASVDLHCLMRYVPKRQEVFDEEIFLKDQVFSLRRALRLEERPGDLRPFIPREKWSDDSFHVDDCLDPFRVALGPIKSERRSPVVNDQDHVLVDIVRSEAAPIGQQVRDDVAPQIRRGRIPVQKNNGSPSPTST
jgi:hypothetical protein